MGKRDAGTQDNRPRSKVRCAIYTRKSTEDGLEQEFNSLDAQYEACAAYIASQQHEGWELVPNRYDDGGFSGGNLKRPGLTQLLADVASGRVQVIVLYKIDRLTRSLSDFSRIVDVLDKADASFVSVTQSFNTTTSMGRLTLNMLLSFAQFEREATGERIRDKVAASKKKGMWMGGPVPLGYEVKERKLIINEAEADKIRHIFRRYAELGTGQKLLDELREQGVRTKLRTMANGKQRGGISFERGALFHLLGNRIYIGEITHKGASYAGEHDAIIESELWDQVQKQIGANKINRKSGRNARAPSLLAGIIFDGHGRRMTPSHAVKSGKRYRYYVTHPSSIKEGKAAWRLPAYDLEKGVVQRLIKLLEDRQAISGIVSSSDAKTLARTFEQAGSAAEKLKTSTFHRRTMVASLVQRVQIRDDEISITLDRAGMEVTLYVSVHTDHPLHITASACRFRRGEEVRLIVGEDAAARPDQPLISLLTEARSVRDKLCAKPDQTIKTYAIATGQCRKRLARLLGLNWLAPEIVTAILDGSQPPALTPRILLRTKLPLDWEAQKTTLGFA